jgi:ABC-type transporter Mla subunit MlaD
MKKRSTLVTTFIVLSLAIVLGTISMILIKNKTFKSKVKFHTKLNTARGLSGFPPIYFKGYTIGKVSSYTLDSDLQITVEFYIYEEYSNLFFEKTLIEKNENIISNQITDFRIILPKKEFRSIRQTDNRYVLERSTKKATELALAGEIEGGRDGISGIVDKVNLILDRFDNNNTSEKLVTFVTELTEMTKKSKETIASYNSVNNPKVKKEFEKIFKQVSSSVSTIEQNLTFLRGILKVLHQNKNEITPILLKTNRTLDNAQDTLEGINNNPLIRGGIRRKKEGIQLETLD